jgi:hypothetical protein
MCFGFKQWQILLQAIHFFVALGGGGVVMFVTSFWKGGVVRLLWRNMINKGAGVNFTPKLCDVIYRRPPIAIPSTAAVTNLPADARSLCDNTAGHGVAIRAVPCICHSVSLIYTVYQWRPVKLSYGTAGTRMVIWLMRKPNSACLSAQPLNHFCSAHIARSRFLRLTSYSAWWWLRGN